MTRVATFAVQQLAFANSQAAQARNSDLQIAVSSGQKSRDYSGIAAQSRQLISSETLRERAYGFIGNIELADRRLESMETAIGEAFNLASGFRSLLVTATSGTNASDLVLAEQATSAMEQLAGLLNSDYDGSYLFSGTRTSSKPVDLDALLNPGTVYVDTVEYSGAATTAGTGISQIPGIVSLRAESGARGDAYQLTYDGAGTLQVRNLATGGTDSVALTTVPGPGETADFELEISGEPVVVTIDSSFALATPIATQPITGTVAGGTGAFGTINITSTLGDVSRISSNKIDLFSPTADASDVTVTLPSADGNFVATGIDLESATGPRDIVLTNATTGATITINVDVTTVISDAAINDPGTEIDLDDFLVNLAATNGATSPKAALPGEIGYDPSQPLYYKGDAAQLTVRADEQVTIGYGVNAISDGFEKLMRALYITRQAASDPTEINVDDLRGALGLAAEAIEAISNHRSEIGTARSNLESMKVAQNNVTLLAEETIGEIENTDVAEALTLIAQNTTLVEASYSTIGRLTNLSILDFI